MRNSVICLICNMTNFKNSNSFTKHLRVHKISSKDYYDKYIHETEEICSCGNKIGFYSIEEGYPLLCRYCSNKNPERVNKIKNTIRVRYGVENVSQVEEFKEKRKKTNLERYGVEYSSSNPEIMKRCLDTWKKKYKDGHPGRDSKVKEKKKQTCLEKYGVDHQFKSKDTAEKSKTTNLERYGVEHAMSNSHISRKSEEGMMKKHGVRKALQCKEFAEKISGSNNYRWINDREQRFIPYTEKFFNEEFRKQIRKEQNFLDPITNESLELNSHLHHIDYNKSNDSRENLIFLSHTTHAKTNTNRDKWKNILEKVNQEIIVQTV